MDSRNLALRQAIGAVVPTTIERPKAFAKNIHRFFRSKSLSECQAATAQVLGHADWHGLDKAVKAGAASAPNDEQLERDAFIARRKAQTDLLAWTLADVEPGKPYAPPGEPQGPTMGMMGMMDPHNMLRVEMAGKRCQRLLCNRLLWEGSPSSAAEPEHMVVQGTSLELATQEVMQDFNLRLARWWTKHIKWQPEVGQAIERFEWNKDRPASIIWMGMYWGELCMYYAETIEWENMWGSAYLLADQYSASILQATQVYHQGLAEKGDGDQWPQKVVDLKMGLVAQYLQAYVRDDVVEIGLPALQAGAKRCMRTMLATKG
jgi:hypothetical protein